MRDCSAFHDINFIFAKKKKTKIFLFVYERHWTLLVVSQNNCEHKTYLVTSNGELLIVNKTLWETAHSEKNYTFWESGNFSLKISCLKPFFGIWTEAHKLCNNGVSFFILLQFGLPILSQKFQRFVILSICWNNIPSENLVFDNHQRWSVPLRDTIAGILVCKQGMCALFLL